MFFFENCWKEMYWLWHSMQLTKVSFQMLEIPVSMKDVEMVLYALNLWTVKEVQCDDGRRNMYAKLNQKVEQAEEEIISVCYLTYMEDWTKQCCWSYDKSIAERAAKLTRNKWRNDKYCSEQWILMKSALLQSYHCMNRLMRQIARVKNYIYIYNNTLFRNTKVESTVIFMNFKRRYLCCDPMDCNV